MSKYEHFLVDISHDSPQIILIIHDSEDIIVIRLWPGSHTRAGNLSQSQPLIPVCPDCD